MRQWLREWNYPTVHSHGWDADLVSWLACLFVPARRLVHLHVTPTFLVPVSLRDRLRCALAKVVLRKSAVVAVSHAVRSHWCRGLGWSESRICVVHNGVDLDRFVPGHRQINPSCVVIGVAARLAPMKGLEYLIEAFARLRDLHKPVKLRIAGEGSLRGSLEAKVAEFGLKPMVEFLGHVEDMPSFYRDIDVFVLPSVAMEGFPLGILEAMSSGLPVVATRVAGAPESVEDGVTGLLVPPRDPLALSLAIGRLVDSPELIVTMGDAGRQRAEREFSLQQFASAMCEVYRNCGFIA
ncbi:MAG: glycosyltransferase family 4 protein [Lysobacterales bacterium]